LIVVRLSLLIVMSAAAGHGQSFAVGVRGGVPLTDDFQTGSGGFHLYDAAFSSAARRYVVGPAVTLPLPLHLGLEVDLLYRRLGYESFSSSFISSSDAGTIYQWTATVGNRLDLPMLVRCPLSRISRDRAGGLYILGGPTLGIHYGFTTRIHQISDLVLAGHSDKFITTHEAGEMGQRVGAALTVGMGYDARTGRLHIKPELRYSRWISPAFDDKPYLQTTANQLAFLLGFDFDVR
jgi:hypothetical protein